VVVTNGEDHELVDNTVVGVDDGLGSGVDRGQVLSIRLAGHEDSAVVILAVADADVEFRDEDVQLFGTLASHAGTAVDRIYDRPHSTPESTAHD